MATSQETGQEGAGGILITTVVSVLDADTAKTDNICPNCQKVFTRKSNFERHSLQQCQAEHTGEWPHQSKAHHQECAVGGCYHKRGSDACKFFSWPNPDLASLESVLDEVTYVTCLLNVWAGRIKVRISFPSPLLLYDGLHRRPPRDDPLPGLQVCVARQLRLDG